MLELVHSGRPFDLHRFVGLGGSGGFGGGSETAGRGCGGTEAVGGGVEALSGGSSAANESGGLRKGHSGLQDR